MKNSSFYFKKAIPVWENNRETEMNYSIELHCNLMEKNDYVLYLTGNSSYLVFANGCFVSYGPARAAHGFYKVDVVPLKKHLKEGENEIIIRGVGYNINSFCHLDTPSFLCAEICLGQDVVVYTDTTSRGLSSTSVFQGFSYPARIQKTQRYSYQRTFAEAYDFSSTISMPITLASVSEKRFIKRDVPYGEYTQLFPQKVFQKGEISACMYGTYYKNREITQICDSYKGFTEHELSCGTHLEYGKLFFHQPVLCDEKLSCVELTKNRYMDLDMGEVRTGLISLCVESEKSGTLLIAFDELMPENELNPFRNESSNVIVLFLKPGKQYYVSAEPYNFRYVRIAAKDMCCTVHDFSLREVAFPESLIRKTFSSADLTMKKIFDAALLSFRANVVDIYMDCPGRERAGWLCDSFFTARVEKLLTGKSEVEKSFLTSFLLPDTFSGLPVGMLPMCYPCDVMNREFIPNWAMWYGLELYEYYNRTKDSDLLELARPRMQKLLSYFQSFENEIGLLQNLEGVVFVDASEANVAANGHNISFPTNMVYAAFQSVLGILYDQPYLLERGRKLRDMIQKFAVTDNGFVYDCADIAENTILPCDIYTEACQYYAFFFKIITPDSHPWLWNTLLECNWKDLELHPANTFIGRYLRLELLSLYGYDMELYNNIREYFSYMAETTGTLWEYKSPTASCNHGFASHVIYWMDKLDLLDNE